MRQPNDDEALACSAADPRADGGRRAIWLTPRGVRIERTVAGIKMCLAVPIEAYRAILSICHDGDRRFCRITLAHKDPDLSVILDLGRDAPALQEIWQSWARFLVGPALAKVLRDAVAQPRRRSAMLLKRRPRIPLRRPPGLLRTPAKVLRGARQLFPLRPDLAPP